MHRVLSVLLLPLACLVLACDGGQEPGPEVLHVGLEAAYPPFETVDDAGDLVGLDVELARLLGEELSVRVEFHDQAFDALIPALQSERVDLICSALSRTDERDAVIDFSVPYARVPMGVLVSTNRVADDATAADLDAEGVVVAVQRGTSGALKARESFPSATVREYDREVDAASEVAAERADAFVYDLVSVVKFHRLHPDTTRILDADLGVEFYAVGLREGSSLKAPVDEFLLRERRPGGRVDALLEHWLGEAERFRVEAE